VSAYAILDARKATDHSDRETGPPLGDLLRRARSRDSAAWDGLVTRLGKMVLHTACAVGLRPADAADAAQLTWMRLLEHIHDIREPEHLPGWLKITARREALRIATSASRYVLYAEPDTSHRARASLTVTDSYPVEGDYSPAVAGALAQLPPQYEKLLRLLMDDTCPSYAQVAGKLGLPVGSIGPMRMRALTMLRRALGLPDQAGQVIDARGAFERAGCDGGFEPVGSAA
jgi:DNA-directed RNA polymerase specialized sigma24 family protein